MRKSKSRLIVLAALLVLAGGVALSYAQEAAPGTMQQTQAAQAGTHKAPSGGPSMIQVIMASGWVGGLIWVALFLNLSALVYFWVDCAMSIRDTRVIPPALAAKVTQAMDEGDVLKALKYCDEEPCPLANVLSAGFSNVEQGFETIQDMVSASAEMESEKLLARVTYLNVCSNMGPLLGLLGTVHGMIFAFSTLASTTAGAAQQAMLAINIAESLYCTATGLLTAIPALGAYYFFKNKATRMILGMEGMTLDLIKSLRNVEVVEQ